jgi:hypothetical protein
VLVLQEQQELVLHEQQLEHEQLELDQASSTDSSVISSISNVALSRALSSSFSSTDMTNLPSCGDHPERMFREPWRASGGAVEPDAPTGWRAAPCR